MVFPLAPEVDDTLRVLKLIVEWEQSPFGAGSSSWHFAMERTALVDQLQGLWDIWEANIKTLWMGRRPADWKLVRAIVREVWPGTTPDLFIDIGEFAGPGATGGAPVQLTPIIKWLSTLPGRSYRGRTYWGQIALADLAYSSLALPLYIQLTDFASAMETTFFLDAPILGVDPKLCIFSQSHNNAPEPKGRYALVRAWQVPPYVAFQRRRQRYYG
jgi:hypothetical protein